jgi:hypothetical protein
MAVCLGVLTGLPCEAAEVRMCGGDDHVALGDGIAGGL